MRHHHRMRPLALEALLGDLTLPERYKVALRIMNADGLRSGEVLGLREEHLEYERGLYRLPKQKNGTLWGARSMSPSIVPVLQRYVWRHRRIIARKGGFIIYNRKSPRPISSGHFSDVIRGHLKKMGLWEPAYVRRDGKAVGRDVVHGIRAKCATECMAAAYRRLGYVPLQSIQLKLGHRNLQSTQSYLQFDDAIVLAAAGWLDRVREEAVA